MHSLLSAVLYKNVEYKNVECAIQLQSRCGLNVQVLSGKEKSNMSLVL